MDIFVKFPGVKNIPDRYLTSKIKTEEDNMDYFEEFNRIAEIAKKYWVTYEFEVALAVLMVDCGIVNAYSFDKITITRVTQEQISQFFKELNSNSIKKYTFLIEETYISKNKIDSNKSMGENIGHTAPEWCTNKKNAKYETFLMLRIIFNERTIYVDTSSLNYKTQMEEKLHRFIEFVNSIKMDSYITVHLDEFEDPAHVGRVLFGMFEDVNVLESETLAFIHNNKSKIISFLADENYFNEIDDIDIDIDDIDALNRFEKEFEDNFESFNLEFWETLIREHIKYD